MATISIDYLILEAGSPEELRSKVLQRLHDNYQVQGGVMIVALGGDDYLYAQAMVFNA